MASPRAVLEWMGDKADNWLTRAKLFTGENERAGRHVKRDNIWSEVKLHLAELQHHKCAYCERLLGSEAVEWTIDHFRPKGAVRRLETLPGGALDVGGASDVGYYLLAYDLANLIATCIPCNNVYKSDFFPTAAARRLDSAKAVDLITEQPYLISPVDPDDVDPELAIGWKGAFPTPTAEGGFGRDRALITIEMLGLATRENLVRARVNVVLLVWSAHQDGDLEYLDQLCDASSPHASCARRFRNLCDNDSVAAKAEVELLRSLRRKPASG